MGYSRPISLFAVDTQTQRKPIAFVVSAFSHVLVAGLILYGFIFAPRINMREEAARYTMREVDISVPDEMRRTNSGNSGMYPGQEKATEHAAAAHSSAAAPSSSIRQIPKLHLSDKTIVQPDISNNDQILKHANLPSLLLWSAQRPKVQLITPPPPQKLAFVNTKPVLTRPTPEQHLADVPVTSTPFTSSLPMPKPASSSPVKVSGPDRAELVPETSLVNSSNPTAASMMSISEMELSKGRISLPAVNQTASGNADGAMQPGTNGNASQRGTGDPNSRGANTGVQLSQGSGGKAPGPEGNRNGGTSGNGGNAGNGAAPSGNSSGGGGQGTAPTFTKVAIPQIGSYGVVVVGSELEEQFPETARLWGGRLVYSVFLHVGMAKNWILQYSLPQSEEALDAGAMKHVDAPWPFYVVRPTETLAAVNADALMIHGVVNESGHFESLAVVFPNGYRQGQLVLAALQQWKFRPAKHNGQVAKVEVLLIIPEDVN